MTDHSTFLQAAAALLDAKGFTCDPDLLEPWLTDWRGRYTGSALGMASPASTNDVAKFVKLCAQHKVAIVPQGGNSGMSGGATPDESGASVLLSLRRMNGIREFDPQAQTIICDAGVILQNLHETAEEAGLRFPLTLGGKGSATIGGLISTNAGGTQVLRHGTMRAQVLGIEAVLPNGDVFDGLTALKGTLGIVTAANLRLVPKIVQRIVVWVGLPSIHAARDLLLTMQSEFLEALEGFEVIPAHCLDSVLAHEPAARAPLEVTHDVVIASNETQAEAFWALRDGISAAERAIGPAMQHDIAVPVAAMPDFIAEVSPDIERKFPGTTAAAFGHLGDGNVHFHVLAPAGVVAGEWEECEGKVISRYVHDEVTRFGGTISAEHGIGQMKREELGRLGDKVALDLMRSIKSALDPQISWRVRRNLNCPFSTKI